MDDIVEQVKTKNPIEDVIEGDGYPLPKRGRYRKCTTKGTGGLVVDVQEQYYYWNSRAEYGDVIGWVERKQQLDFKGAVEWLCQRAGMPRPEWNQSDPTARVAARAREECLDVAMRVFVRWLRANPEAMAYCLRRGWTSQAEGDEEGMTAGTVELARLGYSGQGSQAEREEMRRELITAGVDLNSAAGVAILGYMGDVMSWAKAHNVVPNDDWVTEGRIPGMLGGKRLVYAHQIGGRVVYLSGRGVDKKWHYNLPECLVGKRQVYFNHAYGSGGSSVVVVEGQADAVSLAQWGVGAVALAGVKPDDDLVTLLIKRHKNIYVGLDADEAGQRNAWKTADAFGPLTRMIEWPGDVHWEDEHGEQHAVKDANDLLRSMGGRGVGPEEQAEATRGLLACAETYAEKLTRWAGRQEGAARDEAVRLALGVISRMEELDLSHYRTRLAKALGVGVRELTHMLKTLSELQHQEEREVEPIPTFGGLIDGFMVEYLYDPDTERSSLAWKDPNGAIVSGDDVIINGKRYCAAAPTGSIVSGGVLFPSRLGALKETRELVTYVELFIRSVYMLPKATDAKIMSYYVLLTWIYDAFQAIPYLRATGEPGAGKSELMRRVGLICYRRTTANGASTTATLFRMVERYRGTVFLDEMDLRDSDAANDLIKFINLGAMKNNPITRLDEVMTPEGKTFEERMYQTFCPKLIAMQREFRDQAVATRCITFRVQPYETSELVEAGIPLNITNEMQSKAQALRNMLVAWRLKHWQAEIEIDTAFYDLDISSRLNQVTVPLMALAKDDPQLQDEIRKFLREYYAEMVLGRSMTITARVIEAMWKIYKYPDLRKEMIVVEAMGEEKVLIGNVTRIANEIINEMNAGGEEEKDEKHGNRDELRPHRIGQVVRQELQLRVGERTNKGYFVYWDTSRMTALAKRFGVKPEDFNVVEEKQAQKTTQERMV